MGIYWTLLKASIRSRMQYKLNFILSSVANGLITVVDFIVLFAILFRFRDVMGWNIYEIGMLYGSTSFSFSLYRLVAEEVHQFERYMVNGEFDSLLIRPVAPLTLLLSRNIDFSRVGGILQGVAIISFSLIGLHDDWLKLLLHLPILLVTGTLISFSISLWTAALAFWTQRIRDLQVFTLYAPFNAANYPLTIYPGWLKWLFFSLLPVGFMNYLQFSYLLHKGGVWEYLLLAPLVAVLFFILAHWFWKFGIRFYHSTGS